MRVRITTQKEMQNARKEVTFCYLCGKPLPSRNSKDWSSIVSAEHVVPRSLLVDEPNGNFPVILDVHVACEIASKKTNDNLMPYFQRFYQSLSDDSAANLDKHTDITHSLIPDKESGKHIAVVHGTEFVRSAVQTWVNGFHAALYRKQLVVPKEDAYVLTPFPESHSIAPHDTSKDAESSEQIEMLIENALEGDIWDGIVAWNGTLQYWCDWLPPDIDDSRWICAWILSLPGLEKIPEHLLPNPRPWMGMYRIEAHPRLS